MQARTLTDAMRSRDNSFDLLRVALAAVVIIYHSVVLTGTRVGAGATGLSFGMLAVLTFFGISGFLITGSWLGDSRPRAYLAKRGLRLMPGLIVAAVLTALLLGPLVTTKVAGDYFSDSGTYLYVGKQLLLDTFNPFLPGVFEHNPFEDTVNGSLWTVALEACCYLAVLAGGLLGALSRPRLLGLLLALVVVAMAVAAAPDNARAPVGLDAWLNGLRPCGAFLTGALIWILHERIPRSRLLLALAVAALFLPVSLKLHSAIDIVAIPYIGIVVGTLRPGRLAILTSLGDVSYGTYIYAYPLQQALVQQWSGIKPVVLAAIALPAAWLLGLASWRLVERRALGLRRLIGARAPGPVAAASASAQ